MKKTLTFLAAMVMLAGTAFAQVNRVNAVQKEKSPVQLLKANNPVKKVNAKNLFNRNVLKMAGNPVWNETMSYCLDDDFQTGVGIGTDTNHMYWAIKIEAGALVGRNNITEVEFFVPSLQAAPVAGNYTMKLYFGNPTGTPAATEVVAVTDNDELSWKTITFATPVAVPANQDMWVTFHTYGVAYPAAGVIGNDYDNGKYVSFDGVEWNLVTDYNIDYTWMIRVTSDTYIVLPPVLSLEGPATIRTNDTAFFYAHSENADTFEWIIDADYLDTDVVMNVATVVWADTGMKQVVVMASNEAGDTYDTLNVDVYSCEGITIPYVPSFADGLGCWDTVCDSTRGSGWYTTFEAGLEEGQVYSMSAQNYYGLFMSDFPVDNWLVSPEIEMPASGEYELAWKVKPFNPNYAGDHYAVYALTEDDTVMLFSETLNGHMTNYVQRMAIIPSTITGTFRVAFRHFDCEGGYVIILDSIQFRDLTTPVVELEGPVDVEVGVPASFIAVCGNATSYTWTIDGSDDTTSTNVLSYVFTSAANHVVSVTVANSQGTDTKSLNVESYVCNGVTAFPYSYGFESGMHCWTMFSADPANDDKFGVTEFEDSYAGNYVFRFSSYNTAEDYNQYLISPELTLPTDHSYMIKFKYAAASGAERFRVMTSTTTNDLAAFTHVAGEIVETSDSWTEVAFALPAGTKYVAINYYGNYVYYLYIDEVSIETLSAPTVTLSGETVVEAGSEVVFTASSMLATSYSWTVDGTTISGTTNTLRHTFNNAGNFTVTVTASNSEGSNNASLNVQVYECEHITTFPYHQDFESADGYDCWHFIDADGDGLTWSPDYLRDYIDQETGNPNPQGHSGSNGLVASASWAQRQALTPDNWMIMPAIDLPAGQNLILSWYSKGQDSEYSIEHYSVYISTTGRNISDFTQSVFSGNTTNNWDAHNVSLANYAGQTIYVAFRHHDCTDMFLLDVDDIRISNEEAQGIEEVLGGSLSLYPNPATSTVSVSAEGVEGNVTVQIVDLNGRVMMEQNGKAESFRFDVSTLSQGAYFVRMTGESVNAIRKLIVK